MAELSDIPARINAKTTLTYRRSLADYPASTWTLTVYLAGKDALGVSGAGKAAVADGDDHVVSLTAADLTLTPGFYQYQEVVVGGPDSETLVIDERVIEIKALLKDATSAQLTLEKDLEVIRAAISGRLTSDMQAYQIAGRAVTKIPIEELHELEADRVRRLERLVVPSSSGPKVKVTFPGVS